jgi:hypothetical protein
MSYVILKFTIALGQLRSHDVESARRIDPVRGTVSDHLAKDELMGHLVRLASSAGRAGASCQMPRVCVVWVMWIS